MKDLLFVKKLHLPVFTTQKPDSMSEEEWDFEHQQVCGFIRQYVEDNDVYNHIANETHARALWEKIDVKLLDEFEVQGEFSLMTKLWDYGCLILYQSLGRYFGFQLQTLPRMVLFLFRWQKAVLLMKR